MKYTSIENENRANIVENLSKVITEYSTTISTDSIPKDCLFNKISNETEIVLLGECTHGTQEFYKARANITKQCIKYKGYRVILLEAEWTDIMRINKYILGTSDDSNALESLINIQKFPLWMWKNDVIVDLIEWIKTYNNNNPSKKVYMFGMDCQQFIRSYREFIDFLYLHDEDYFEEVVNKLGILSHLSVEQEPEYAKCAVHGELKYNTPILVNNIQEILSTYQWEKVEKYFNNSQELNIDPIDILSSEQSIEILVNGEEYFRKMVEEPPGSQASWNTRDQHMLMTIMRIRNRMPLIWKNTDIPKIIVWAHNSHIGNSNATNRGGDDFSQNNTWNLGQMVKEMFPKTFACGFYTNSGTVAAGNGDSIGNAHSVSLSSANEYSYEHFLHLVTEKMKYNSFILDMRMYHNIENRKHCMEDIVTKQIPGRYRFIHRENKITETKDIQSACLQDCVPEYEIFTAVERHVTPQGISRLRLESGGWITEFVSHGSITLYCIEENHILNEEPCHFLSSNLMQRWIGVNYIKKNEIHSHYGESSLVHQYDTIVYIDNTNALVSPHCKVGEL